MDEVTLSSLFGGVPFLDKSFRRDAFLTGVACTRRYLHFQKAENDQNLGDLVEYLEPDFALDVYDQILGRSDVYSSTPLTIVEARQVADAIKSIRDARPEWDSLVGLKVNVSRLFGSRIIASSNASRPQHIYLGEKCWRSQKELREQVLHEMAHIWLYMIEEMWPLCERTSAIYTLPSGTTNKTAGGVLNAVFVALVLADYYGKTERHADYDRQVLLREYAQAALTLIHDCSELTSIGIQLLSRFQAEILASR